MSQTETFGFFNGDGSEYHVTEPNTPLPFVNYYWNDTFLSGASQHMAGIGCFTERPMQYMHREGRALLVRDENRHFYLRDDDTGDIWSPGWYPALAPVEDFDCRHGLGYSVLTSARAGIRTTLRVFVPRREPCEVWTLTLTNTGDTTRHIKSYAFVDWLLTGYPQYCDYHSNLRGEYDEAQHIVMCFNDTSERTHPFFNGFIASDKKPSGFDSSRKAFVGYHQVDRPKAVAEGRCTNSLAACEKLVGALEHSFTLTPGAETTVHILIGAADTLDYAREICSSVFGDADAGDAAARVEASFSETVKIIKDGYSAVHFTMPDPKAAHLFNHWIKRSVQLHTEVGTDTGKGLRDVLQAAWAVSAYDPDGARNKIIECLRHQYREGHTLRGWDPVDDHHYSDGPVWIAPAIDAYLKETCDFAFLETKVPYFDGGEGTVLEHMLTSIRHSTEDLGPRGLIRAHYGDWNDSLNMMGTGGQGESVWTSIAMVYSIRRAAEIARYVLNDDTLTTELDERTRKLSTVINDKGWDGDWYLEGINDAGEKVGTHTEKEGRVYLNPQTWAILSEVVPDDRLEQILRVIDNDLECDYGSLVLTPAYRTPNPGIGRLSWFTPGMWENASPYCHGTAFKIMADTALKRGDIAWRSVQKILPDSAQNPSSHSGVPPYMVTNMYYGPEHPRKGEILYSWITGTADWLFKAMCGHIMGVRATYDGLVIDPCVPSHWDSFALTRGYRGAVYDVRFSNPDGKQSGVASITVDGRLIEGRVLPVFDSGTHIVEVVM